MVERENVWPLGGYAPGNYTCVCRGCDKQFFADKRANQCLECAVVGARAALRAGGEPVAVKPLEWRCSSKWEPGEFVTEWCADSIAGTYRIWCDPTVDPNCWHVEYPERPFEGSEHAGIEAAKAAAQADYEQRIRSALVSATGCERDSIERYEHIATVLGSDPYGDSEGPLYNRDDRRKLEALNPGDRVFVLRVDAALSTSTIAPDKAEARREALEEATRGATWGQWERAQQEKERGE